MSNVVVAEDLGPGLAGITDTFRSIQTSSSKWFSYLGMGVAALYAYKLAKRTGLTSRFGGRPALPPAAMAGLYGYRPRRRRRSRRRSRR